MRIELDCPLFDSPRVREVAGMFDVPLAERLCERFDIDPPPLGFDWQIGLIVGPSGSGKTTLARHLFADSYVERFDWPDDRAVIDCFGESPTAETTRLLTAVGFSSPPSWIKPYHVLSNGEKFRCDLARALAVCDREQRTDDKGPGTVLFDEFTSVVDRNVARIGSAAVAKSIRAGHVNCRFVAVTCHGDVHEWLAPDWTIEMPHGRFQRRRLRRPTIELSIHRCTRDWWPAFARHHYLSGSLNPAVRCFVAVWNEDRGLRDESRGLRSVAVPLDPRSSSPAVPVAFCATLPIIGKRGHWRISRIVTLPDYQGIGIGWRLMEAVAQLHRAQGLRLNVTAAHPAILAHCRRSPDWRLVRVRRSGSKAFTRAAANYCGSPGRSVASFEYVR